MEKRVFLRSCSSAAIVFDEDSLILVKHFQREPGKRFNLAPVSETNFQCGFMIMTFEFKSFGSTRFQNLKTSESEVLSATALIVQRTLCSPMKFAFVKEEIQK